jgi:hypothetical protein
MYSAVIVGKYSDSNRRKNATNKKLKLTVNTKLTAPIQISILIFDALPMLNYVIRLNVIYYDR